jgi:imidazoleglycerol-phosphate dehydratase/histidinol-phosphatase
MRKALFIDRDGTLIVEPPDDFQVDSLEKLEFLPGVFRNLYMIRQWFDYELVVVTNQDGLGTTRYPEEKFNLVQGRMLTAFRNEGVIFDDILIDRSLPSDNLPTRKPGTGMLTRYLSGQYDLSGSYVIGDRLTDLELARNLGVKGILIGNNLDLTALKADFRKVCVLTAGDWDHIFDYLRKNNRKATVTRKTLETNVTVDLSLDGNGMHSIKTGLGFFDHMMEQVARHGNFNLVIQAEGDLHVDEHHTIEDVAITLGEAFNKALGNMKGIERYAFLLPMDESLSSITLDLGGRSWLEWDVSFHREKIGDLPTEMFEHFFRSFVNAARCSLHIQAKGRNEHHLAEAIFKSFGRVLKSAVRQDIHDGSVPSTKGVI